MGKIVTIQEPDGTLHTGEIVADLRPTSPFPVCTTPKPELISRLYLKSYLEECVAAGEEKVKPWLDYLLDNFQDVDWVWDEFAKVNIKPLTKMPYQK